MLSMSIMVRNFWVLLVAFCVIAWMTPSAYAQSADKPVDFARHVLPVLSNKCFVCHGPDTKQGDLRLDSYEGATLDRDGSRGIDPANISESAILERIHSKDDPMPPRKAEKKLTDEERELLTRWVKQGGKYTKHWAFVPPVKAQLPVKPQPAEQNITNKSQVIDAFIEAQLSDRDLKLAPQADRATLARRAALVLTGLPPEREQLERYLADTRPDAYERLVDELLQSPRYGEHQARYWLDAVRYGDTHGLHLDNKRGIYPYRDWIVRAFNRNLPLNNFITWQLAGDLLPDPTLDQIVATGFVRMNPTTAEGGAIPAEFQAKNSFDRTETMGTVLLGMTFSCARCHTHKYDPITHDEYYSLLAFFNSTAESSMDGNAYIYGPIVKAPQDQTGWQAWDDWSGQRDALLKEAQQKLAVMDITDGAAKQWEAANADAKLKLLTDDKSPMSAMGLKDQAKALLDKRAAMEATFTTTLVATELPKPRETRVLRRGEYDQPIGDVLKPDVPAVMGHFPKDAPRNRLGLAQWLVSREHPLVSRVLINQLWLHVFGEGLVRTPEDFGMQGEQSTHPQLLDWLAVELHDSGWNMKQMLRLMVTSQTFKQQSNWRKQIADPTNRLLARGPSHRLDAEVLRDVGLWSSGLLQLRMGGEGVKPYQPPGMWLALAHPGSNTKKYEADKGEKLYQRSLYVYWKRTSPHPMMTLFDAPSRETSCIRRSRSSTPLQSLGLLNETQRVEMARTLAQRLIKEATDDGARLNLLYELLASRKPSERERATCESLLAQMRKRYEAAPKDAVALLTIGDSKRDESLDAALHAAWTQVTTIVLASDAAILLY